MPSVSEAIEFRQREYGWTAEKMAKALGLTSGHYSELMHGKRRLPYRAACPRRSRRPAPDGPRGMAMPVPPVPLVAPVQRDGHRKPLRGLPVRDMQDRFYRVAASQRHRLGGLRA